jgi:hypothetical protein
MKIFRRSQVPPKQAARVGRSVLVNTVHAPTGGSAPGHQSTPHPSVLLEAGSPSGRGRWTSRRMPRPKG